MIASLILKLLGVEIARFQEMPRIFRDNIGLFHKIPTKSMAIEHIIGLINPQGHAGYLVMGMLLGGHEAQFTMYRKMTR